MNTKDYLREGYHQLSDPNFYCKLDHDDHEVDETLSQMKAKGLSLMTILITSALTITVKEGFTFSQKFTKRVS